MYTAPLLNEWGPCAWPWNNPSAYRQDLFLKRDDLNFPTSIPGKQGAFEIACLLLFIFWITSFQHPTSWADPSGDTFLEKLMQTLQLNLLSLAMVVWLYPMRQRKDVGGNFIRHQLAHLQWSEISNVVVGYGDQSAGPEVRRPKPGLHPGFSTMCSVITGRLLNCSG